MKKMTARPLSNQHGSIAVMAVLAISTTVILLASIDIGYLFYQKRELQKVADMAAIAGAQQLAKESSSCASSITAAIGNAGSEHQFIAAPPISTFFADCGQWNPDITTVPPHYDEKASDTFNAVRVHVSESFGSFFGAWAEQRVNAMAIATIGSPTAVFSVESRLLRIEGDGTVPKLLADLGVDIDGTTLVSGAGMANARVTTSGLLRELGFNIPIDADIATAKEIVSVGSGLCAGGICPLDALLDAIGTVGGQDHLGDAEGITAGQMKLPVKLLTDASGRGLFTILDAANGKSALDADINASEFLSTALAIANSHNAVPLDLGTNIPGVIEAENKIGIVESPSIGIGGIGATAYTSQIRLFTHVNSSRPPLLTVNLPLAIDVVNGKGTIVDMCTAKDSEGNDTVTIKVDSPMLSACVGALDKISAFSTNSSCDAGIGNEKLLNVLGNTLSLETNLSIEALPNSHEVTLSKKNSSATIPGNSLDLGTSVNNLMTALTANILGKLLLNGQENITTNNLTSELLNLNNASANVLKSTITTINDSLKALRIFSDELTTSVSGLLVNTLDTSVINVLNDLGGVVSGLINTLTNLLGNLLGNVGCLLSGNYNQCMVEKQLDGSQGGISNVLLTLLGLVTQLLQPILNALGNSLATLLEELAGVNLGQVDVTLIDLNCGGGDNIKLVY